MRGEETLRTASTFPHLERPPGIREAGVAPAPPKACASADDRPFCGRALFPRPRPVPARALPHAPSANPWLLPRCLSVLPRRQCELPRWLRLVPRQRWVLPRRRLHVPRRWWLMPRRRSELLCATACPSCDGDPCCLGDDPTCLGDASTCLDDDPSRLDGRSRARPRAPSLDALSRCRDDRTSLPGSIACVPRCRTRFAMMISRFQARNSGASMDRARGRRAGDGRGKGREARQVLRHFARK